MSPHTIQRIIVEVLVRDATQAQRASDAVSALAAHHIAPMLDRHFSVVGGDLAIERIDRLVIDLGRLSPASLERDFLVRLEELLPNALGAARPVAGAAPGRAEAEPIDRALLLLSQFARTGSLPWWSDASQSRVLEEAIATAHNAAPQKLASALRHLAEAGAMERLVPHFSEAALAGLLTLLSQPAALACLRLGPVLAALPAFAGFSQSGLRTILWQEAFAVAGSADALVALLGRLAAVAGCTTNMLRADIDAAEAHATNKPSTEEVERSGRNIVSPAENPTSTLARTLDAGEKSIVPQEQMGAAPPGISLKQRLDRLAASRPALRGLIDRLQRITERLPATGRDEAEAALDVLHAGIGPGDETLWPSLAALLRPFVNAGLFTLADISPALAALLPRITTVPRQRREAADFDTETVYVETAGISLLWPFLARFFGRLDLLADDASAFAGEAARHRAVSLLHHLATGEREAPEPWQALNKVLCGLSPDTMALLGPPVTDAEAGEAEGVLAAAIAHADCLGDIAIGGFRGSFLVRRGALSTRDGAWLLRVERQAPDLLLERLPWNFTWIRLPWMQAPLRVEW